MPRQTLFDVVGLLLCALLVVGLISFFSFTDIGRSLGGAEPLQRDTAPSAVSIRLGSMNWKAPAESETVPAQFKAVFTDITHVEAGDFIIVYLHDTLGETVGGKANLVPGQKSVEIFVDCGDYFGEINLFAYHNSAAYDAIAVVDRTLTITPVE